MRLLGAYALLLLAAFAAVVAVAAADGGAPKTTITSGPLGQSDSATARFTFGADQPATFQCQLDGGAFAPCSSPYTTGPLKFGSHEFSVRAINSAGAADSAPPVRQWLVVPSIAAPAVKLLRPPSRRVRAATLHRLSGTATAPSGVAAVEVALQRGGPDKSFFPPKCTFVDLRVGGTRKQDCLLPAYTVAHGTTNWGLAIPAAVRQHLAPGRYELLVRALNRLRIGGPQKFSLTITR